MKVERIKKAFEPVVIMLETEREVNALKYILRYFGQRLVRMDDEFDVKLLGKLNENSQ